MHSKTENIIVGSTGFVGQTLVNDIPFAYQFNSKNLHEIVNCPDGCNLYLSCLPATKWKVNQNLVADIENINYILKYLTQRKYARVYLISTIDVYGYSPLGSDESYYPNYSGLGYGSNRLTFESLIKHFLDYDKYYIFRLPALFGENLKKNIIFDLMNDNQVEKINVNSSFQWYDMKDLSKDICEMTYKYPDAELYNLFPEPIQTKELIDRFFPGKVGTEAGTISYDYRTKYSETGYLYSKEVVFNKIGEFLK